MQPIIIEDAISVAATSVNDNVIVSNTSLRRYLRCPFPAQGKLIAAISATGLRVSLDYGSKNVVGESDLRVGTDMQDPLDMLSDTWFPDEGDQMVLRAINTTGAAITLRYRILLNPLEEGSGRPPDCRMMQRGPVAIANNSVDLQLLSGLRYERAPVDSIMSVYMTASAAGMTRQVFLDTNSIAPSSAIAPLNRVPQDPFDLSVEEIEAPANKQIEISVTNTSGGSLNAFWKMRLQETYRT